jgi:hypothetical protein
METLDYYLENGMVVFTEQFLLNRGYCCNSGCRHCPYKKKQNEYIKEVVRDIETRQTFDELRPLDTES